MTTPDTGDDAGEVAGDDAGEVAGDDAGEDAGNDAGEDAGNDAGEDAGNDAAAGDRGAEPPASDSDDEVVTGDRAGTADDRRQTSADTRDPAEPEDRPEAVPDVAAAADREELTGPERRLDPRIRYVWVAQSLILAAILGAAGGAIGIGLDYGPLVGGAVFLVVAALGVGHSVLRFRSWRYQVRGDSLYLERGVFTHVKTVVPYVRIQHVDASRGPLERLIGLASSVVYTAGSRGADVTIPGLTPERSEELQARLKQLAIAAEGDDAV